jgi:ATP-dependent RNA helicase RhlB
MKFTELPFDEKVLKGIEEAGFTDCTIVQEKVLPVALTGCDLMVQSKTGSGKTAIYVLTVLQNIAKCLAEGKEKPKALIVAPTRELAVQIEADAKTLASGFDNVKVGAFYGGVGYEKQDKIIAEGCDICVGTPGRLLDFEKGRKIDFREFNIFVLDEADRMFDMGFYPDVQKMFSLLASKEKRQTTLFSATLSTKVRNLAWQYMNEPEEIEVEPEEITVKKITQELYHISKDEKFNMFLQLMVRENPGNALVFTNTKAKAVEVSKRLSLNGFTAQYLMGDMPQSKRLQTLNKMKTGELKFLVATDVAARGLQIDDLELVINYDIPEDFESYVHRIGRTARAGKTGKAITLACEEYIYGLEPIETYIGMKIPVVWPAEGELPEVDDKSKGKSFRDLVSQKEYASKKPLGARRSNTRGGKPYSKDGKRPSDRKTSDSRHSDRRPNDRKSSDARVKDRRPSDGDSVSTYKRSANTISNYKRPTDSKSSERGNENRPYKKEFKKDYNREYKGDGKSQGYKNAPRPKNAKSYDEIQLMSLDDRLAYYKKQYGGANISSTPKKKKPGAPMQNAQKPSRTYNKDANSDSRPRSNNGGRKRTYTNTNSSKPYNRADNTSARVNNTSFDKDRGTSKVKPKVGSQQAKAQTTSTQKPKKKGFFAKIFKK